MTKARDVMTITNEMVERAFLVLLEQGVVADCDADREAVRASLEAAFNAASILKGK